MGLGAAVEAAPSFFPGAANRPPFPFVVRWTFEFPTHIGGGSLR